MGDQPDSITQRLKRLFRKDPVPPKKMSASQVIRPEEVIRESGKRAPRMTPSSGRPRVAPLMTISELQNGITHANYHSDVLTATTIVRDPITRRLSRKHLEQGMRRTTGYYDKTGALYDERDADW